jgi:hypothetical protein
VVISSGRHLDAFRQLPGDSLNWRLGETDPLWIEEMVWLSLFEAARLSVEYKTAICFQ